jgi:hypothetical protein
MILLETRKINHLRQIQSFTLKLAGKGVTSEMKENEEYESSLLITIGQISKNFNDVQIFI